MSYYNELLSICGFDNDEIIRQKQRIERVFDKLGFGPADMQRAVNRVRKNFEITLVGVRKALGVWLKELFDVVLAGEEGKKIIYFGYPPFQYTGLAIKAAAESKENFYIGCPEVVLCHTLGQIFDRLAPLLETGEAKGLAPGHAMCSLLQIKNGAFERGIIPIPDLAIATSYFCDMGPKAEELMQHKYGFQVQYLDSCLDSPWGKRPAYDQATVRYLGSQLNDLFGTLKDIFGIDINDETWKKGRNSALRMYLATNELLRHLTADPMPLSSADAELILNFPLGCTGVVLDEGAEAIEILASETAKRVEQGIGVIAKGAPRVVLGFHSLSDPVVNRLFEDIGLSVPVVMTTLPPPPSPDRYPYETLGEKRAETAMFGGFYHSSYGWVARNTAALKFTEVDGVIWNYPFSCRPIMLNGKLAKEHIEKETGLPTLLLEMDVYDNRSYTIGSLRTRIEAFAEMLKARKAVSP